MAYNKQNTPGIFKIPFFRFTYQWDKAVYVCINKNEACTVDEIMDKSICINGDIGEVIRQLGS